MRKMTILIPVVLFLLAVILVACADNPAPVEQAAQHLAAQPTAGATVVIEAATATSQPVPSAASTADVDESASPAATYEDEVAGFALDYPSGWQIVDVASQIKASASNYTVSFLSWQPAAGGTEGIPEGETKVDVSALPGPAATLQEAVTAWKQQMTADPAQKLLSETAMTTTAGLQAVRWTVESSRGRTLAVMTLVNGRPVLFSGQGDEAILERMVQTLRPARQATSGEGQAARTATPHPEAGLPAVGSAGSPPSSGCVVYQSGRVGDEALPTVHAEPDPESAIIGQLGRNRWATGLRRENGWIAIALGDGQTGWVTEAGIGLSDECAFDVPLIMNRGAPANDRCVAMVGQPGGHAVDVRSAAGEEHDLVAQLATWAEVRQSAGGWYAVEIPQGGTGWVEGSQVALSTGCEAPDAE